MRYFRGTSKLGLTFENGKPVLIEYIDSDLTGDNDTL